MADNCLCFEQERVKVRKYLWTGWFASVIFVFVSAQMFFFLYFASNGKRIWYVSVAGEITSILWKLVLTYYTILTFDINLSMSYNPSSCDSCQLKPMPMPCARYYVPRAWRDLLWSRDWTKLRRGESWQASQMKNSAETLPLVPDADLRLCWAPLVGQSAGGPREVQVSPQGS